MRPMRLISGCRVGMKVLRLVHAKAIERAGADSCGSRKVSALFRVERLKRALRAFNCALFQDKIDILRFRCPKTEVRFVTADQLRANGITTFWFHCCISRFDTLAALPTPRFRSHPGKRNTRALLKSTPCRRRWSCYEESLIIADQATQIAL